MRHYSLLALLALCASAVPGTRATLAADGEEPVRCISISRINRTEVIDDRTIAFFMKGGDIYLNTLDRACRELNRRYPFSYSTSTGRICNADSITVLGDFGLGLTRVDSCGLGEFEPATEEDIEMLRDEQPAADVTVEAIDVEVEAVEVEAGPAGEGPAGEASETPAER